MCLLLEDNTTTRLAREAALSAMGASACLVGGHVYHATTLTYAGQFMTCSHCGHPITGELVRKKRKDGGIN